MSKIWEYFKKEAGIAFCKNCDYKPKFPPQASATNLVNHLKRKHSELYKEFSAKTTVTKEQQSFGIKRAFSSSAGTSKSSVLLSDVDEEIEELMGQNKSIDQPKIDRIWARSPWEMGGEKANIVNKKIVEFIAVDLQPFSVVEDIGFKRLINELQPKYRIPSRKFFTEKLLPDIFNTIKCRIRAELSESQYISYTTDCWSSTDGAHSLLCLTAHFLIKSQRKFFLLAVKPIKGRHNATALKELIRSALEEFGVEEKSFLVVRDAAEVMVKTCDDLALRSLDCFAHKLNLSIWDGIRQLYSDMEIKDIFERIKKFIRKYKKSPILRQEFQQVQRLEQLPQLALTKEMEVRWGSTFQMLDRFIKNAQTVKK